MAISSKKFIQKLKTENPNRYRGFTDSEIYELGKVRYPNANVETFVEEPTQTVEDVDTSPQYTNSFVEKLDYGFDENSWNVHKMAFNNSMTGLAYKFYTGKDRYPEVVEAIENGEYEPGVLEQVYSGLLAFAFPLDLATFGAGALAGKGAAVGVRKLAQKGAAKKHVRYLAKKKAGVDVITKANKAEVDKAIASITNVGEQIAVGGLNFGLFSGATNSLIDLAEQSSRIEKGEQEDFDTYSAIKSAMIGSAEGLLLGGATGVVGSKFAKKRFDLEKKIKAGEKVKTIDRLTFSLPSEVAVEGGMFTATNLAFYGAPKDKDGNFDVDAFASQYLVNTGFVGAMKAFNPILRKYEEIQERSAKAIDKKLNEAANEPQVSIDQLKNLDGVTAKDVQQKIAEAQQEAIDKILSVKELNTSLPKLRERIESLPSLEEITKMSLDEKKKYIAKNKTLVGEYETIKNALIEVIDINIDQLSKDNKALENLIKQSGIDKKTAGRYVNEDLQEYRNLRDKIDSLPDDYSAVKYQVFKQLPKETTIEGKTMGAYLKGKKVVITGALERKLERPLTDVEKKSTKADLTRQLFSLDKEIKEGKKDVVISALEDVGLAVNLKAARKAAKQEIEDLKPGSIQKKRAEKRQNEYKKELKEDDRLALAQFGIKGQKEHDYAKIVQNFLRWFKKPWSKAKKDDIYNYFNKSLLKGPNKNKLSSKDVSAFSIFGKFTDDTWTNKNPAKYISFDDANKNRYLTRQGVEFEIKDFKKALNVTKVANKLKKVYGDVASILANTIKYGLRRQEIYKITPNHLQKVGNDYVIRVAKYNPKTKKFSTGLKRGTLGRPVPIAKSLYNDIIAYAKSLKLKDTDVIFDKKKLKTKDGKALLAKIGKDIFGDDYLYRDSREMIAGRRLSSMKVTEGEGGFYLGNTPGPIQKIYDIQKRSLKDQIKIAKKVQAAVGIIGKKAKAKAKKVVRKRENIDTKETIATTRYIKDIQKEFNLSDDELLQLSKDRMKGTLGQYEDNVIRIVRGETSPETILHEIVHFDEGYTRKAFEILTNKKFKVAKDRRNIEKLRKRIKLYDKLDKITVKSKEYQKWQRRNTDKDSVEFYTDEVAVQLISREKKGIGASFKRWLKDWKATLATSLFGGKFATFKDVSRLLAKDLKESFSQRDKNINLEGATRLLGGDRASAEIIRFKTKDNNSIDALRRQYNAIQDKLFDAGIIKDKRMPDERIKVTGIEDFSGDVSKETLNKWINYLNIKQADFSKARLSAPAFVSGKDKDVWVQNYFRYHRDAARYIDSKTENFFLKNLIGVKNGDIHNASAKDILKLELLAKERGVKPKNLDTVSEVALMDQFGEVKKWGDWKTWAVTHLLPVWYAADKMGAKKISNKMLEHFATEQVHIGRATVAENKILGLIGSKDLNNLRLMVDKEAYADLANPKTIGPNGKPGDARTASQKAFHKKVFDSEGKVRDTNEGKAYQEARSLATFYFDSITNIANKLLLKNKITKPQHERFITQYNKKYVEDYFPRKVTKQFLENANLDEKAMLKAVRNSMEKEAEKQALNSIYDKGKSHKQALKEAKNQIEIDAINKSLRKKVTEYIEDPAVEAAAKSSLESQISFSPEVLTNSHLKKRGIKLPEYMEFTNNDGKKVIVKTYENNYAETMGSYARIMSKYVATAEQFPEFTSIMRELDNSSQAKVELFKFRGKNAIAANWLTNRIKDQMGVGRKELIMYPLTDGLSQAAAVTSKVALSFPTAGLKNAIIGQVQNFAQFGFKNTIYGMTKAFNHDAKLRYAKTGQQELSTRPIEEFKTPIVGKRFSQLLDLSFAASLMKPTEGFNRITAMYAGRAQASHLLKSASKNKNLRKNIKDYWHLTDYEMDVLDLYGFDSSTLNNVKFKNNRNKVLAEDALDRAILKVDTWSSINTQGGTASVLAPYWFNNSMTKPFLLFQRMAYAASFNTYNYVIKPSGLVPGKIKSGKTNVIPLVRFMAGSAVGGYTLMKAYDWALGVQPPNESNSFGDRLITYMWKAEMLGLASEVLSPFSNDGQLTTSLYPAIHKNAVLLNKNFWEFIGDKKTAGQTFDDSMKGVYSLYNQSARLLNRKFNKYNDDYLRTKRLMKDFKKEREIEEPVIDFVSTNSKYYRDFKDAFNKSSKQDAARKFLAAYMAITDEFVKKGYTARGARKQAKKVMKAQIKNLNPIGLSATRGDRVISMKKDFLNYLDPTKGSTGNKKFYDMVINAEKQYQFRWREVQKEISKIIKERGLQDFTKLKHTPRKVIL